jgi:hypothetical protein
VKILLSTFLVLLSTSVFAQDLCDRYQDKYNACIEARDAGNNMSYSDCATYDNPQDCEDAGCHWNPQGLPQPGTCTTIMCRADTDFNGRITGGDITALKEELARMYCPMDPYFVWNPSDGADGYKFYENRGSGFVLKAITELPRYALKNVLPGASVAVSAFNEYGESGKSDSVNY